MSSSERSEVQIGSGSDAPDTNDTSVSGANNDFKPLFEALPSHQVERFASEHHNALNHPKSSDSLSESVQEHAPFGNDTIAVKVDKPLCGSYNAIYKFHHPDNVQWALKVPKNGYEGGWTSQEADNFAKHVQLLKFLKQKTSIPVPLVIDHDASLSNSLGAPFVLMDWISGQPASQVWRDESCSDSQLREKRVRLIRDLACAMKQLESFQFDFIGLPDLEDLDGPYDIGPFKETEMTWSDEHFWSVKEVFIGPFRDQKSFFHAMFTRKDDFDDTIQIFLDWALEHCHQEDFVLTHQDLHLSNLVADNNGHLLGVLDWDLALAAPRCVGNATYPVWLNSDLMEDLDSDDECEAGDHNPFQSRSKFQRAIALGHSELHHEYDFYRAVWRYCISHLYPNGEDEVMSGNVHKHEALRVDNILAATPRTYDEGLTEQHSMGMSTIRLLTNDPMFKYPKIAHILAKISMLERKRPWLLKQGRLNGNRDSDSLGLSRHLSAMSFEDRTTSANDFVNSSDVSMKAPTGAAPGDGVERKEIFPNSLALNTLLDGSHPDDAATVAKVKDWFLYLLYLP
ncbi:MAG: hypothetical protein M1831_000318 [Alyxoria varia]|nr:MAG: hypothetical protein M1831_000318 [Alyxoria varia]